MTDQYVLLNLPVFDCLYLARQADPATLEDARRILGDLFASRGMDKHADSETLGQSLAKEALRKPLRHRLRKFRARREPIAARNYWLRTPGPLIPPKFAREPDAPRDSDVVIHPRVTAELAQPMFAHLIATVEPDPDASTRDVRHCLAWLGIDVGAGHPMLTSVNIGPAAIGYIPKLDRDRLVEAGVTHLPEIGRCVAVNATLIGSDTASATLALSLPIPTARPERPERAQSPPN